MHKINNNIRTITSHSARRAAPLRAKMTRSQLRICNARNVGTFAMRHVSSALPRGPVSHTLHPIQNNQSSSFSFFKKSSPSVSMGAKRQYSVAPRAFMGTQKPQISARLRKSPLISSQNTLLGSLNFVGLNHPVRFKYGEKVLEHFDKSLDPKTQKENVRKLDKNDPNVGTGWVGAPACGDLMKLQIKVNPETKKIEDACFKTFGCGSAVASSSVITEMIKDKTIDEALQIKNSTIAEFLSLPPVKIHCSVLAQDAVYAAVKDVKKKWENPA